MPINFIVIKSCVYTIHTTFHGQQPTSSGSLPHYLLNEISPPVIRRLVQLNAAHEITMILGVNGTWVFLK